MRSYELTKVVEQLHEGHKALSWRRLETEKKLVGLEVDRDEAIEQKNHGMVAILNGECKRVQAYLTGLKEAEELVNG